MSNESYDIIVIGAGSGGLNIAGFMNRAGFKVLLIDKHTDAIGGDCLNFGCVPSKALIHVARIFQKGMEAKEFGASFRRSVDMKKVAQYIRGAQNIIREHENADYFRRQGMAVEIGPAEFVSRNEVRINGKIFSGQKIIIATGSRPRQLEIPGISDARVHTNETIFSIEELPKKFVIVGGGPIGFEIGQAFAMLGAKVTIISRDEKLLRREDADIRDVIVLRMERNGVRFKTEAEPIRVDNGTTLICKTSVGEERIQFDALLVAIGRQLNIEGLALERAGVRQDERGKIIVDEYLRTTNTDIFVCGDIAGGPQFTHAAELHASVILKNFFSPLKKKVSYDSLSWVTYTSPELATFGLSEQELKARSIRYSVLSENFSDNDRSITDNAMDGKMKIFIAKGKVLGGTMVGENAGELVQELILAQSSGLHIKHIFGKIYPYPTASRINKQAISRLFAGKLTNINKALLKLLYH